MLTKEEIVYTTETTFAEVLELWMTNNRIRLKGATVNKYQNLIDAHILPELGDIPMKKLDATVINSYLMHKLQEGRLDKQGGLSASYVRSIRLIINAAFEFAVRQGTCRSLNQPIYKPTLRKPEITILNIDDQQRLERYLSAEPDPIKVGILLTLYTGMRIGEICALSWDDVDLEEQILHIRHTVARVPDRDVNDRRNSQLIIDTPKTVSSRREVPIPSYLVPMLKEIRQKSNSDYVVSSSKSFLSPRTYEYRYHRLLQESGVPQIHYHALRHTFATRCIEAGVDIKSLSEILGHANVGITLNTYVHSSMKLKRAQLEKMVSFTEK